MMNLVIMAMLWQMVSELRSPSLSGLCCNNTIGRVLGWLFHLHERIYTPRISITMPLVLNKEETQYKIR
jgi:hypothetical protein